MNPPGPSLREYVGARNRREVPPASVYPADEWAIVEKRFVRRLLPQTETIFSVANGYLGIRGSFEEESPVHHPGTYLNGFYETWPITYSEDAYGYARTGQTMLNVTDGTIIKLYVDDEPFAFQKGIIHEFERRLDFRTGTLDRHVLWETPDGRRIRIDSRRLVSLEHRHLACIQYDVTVLDGEASLTLSSELATHHASQASEDDPRSTRAFDEEVLLPIGRYARGTRVILGLGTRSSGLRMSAGMDHVLLTTCEETHRVKAHGDEARLVYQVEARPGETVQLTKYLAYHHSATAPYDELEFRASQTLDRAMYEGMDAVLESQERVLGQFWSDSDVRIEGDPEAQQAIRFNVFSLLQASARIEGFGIPAKGLTGEAYEGHYFWDTEIYVMPFLVYTDPHAARAVLLNRSRMLPEARERAAELGHRGATFPWRTINGEEASAYYAAGTAQYHINADIAHAVVQYLHVTGDADFHFRHGIEILIETARLWADLGFFSDRKDGKFVINSVTGPDEYTTVVNNNAFTNLMARENLRYAVRGLEWLRSTSPEEFEILTSRTRLDLSEPGEWQRIADNMYLPYDERKRVHLQDDDFLDLEVWDFANTAPDKYPLLLHYHPLVIYRHQVIKQADVVLATFLLGNEFTPGERRRVYEYYTPLTTGDSSLSGCIQSIMAAETGHLDSAYEYFCDAVVMDLGDIGGNVAEGLHIASSGGTWMAIVYGFAGMQENQGNHSFRPQLPAEWSAIAFPLRIRGQSLAVRITHEDTTYELREGTSLTITHCDRALRLEPGEPVTVPTSP